MAEIEEQINTLLERCDHLVQRVEEMEKEVRLKSSMNRKSTTLNLDNLKEMWGELLQHWQILQQVWRVVKQQKDGLEPKDILAQKDEQQHMDKLEKEQQDLKQRMEELDRKEQELKERSEQRMEELDRKETELKERSEQRMEELDRKEQELKERSEQLEKKEQELKERSEQFEEKCKKWKEPVTPTSTLVGEVNEEQYKKWKDSAEATSTSHASSSKDSKTLIDRVRQANVEVVKDKEDLNEKLVKAEEARVKFVESERVLKEKVECLQNYLHIVEQQGHLPEAVYFHELLRSVRHIPIPKVKCFISYAWQPVNNAELQARLVKLKGDLKKTGIEVMLDIHNMEGDIDRYMMDGIDTSDRVLLICTPRLKGRAEEEASTPNNLQKEFQAALARQKGNPKFIIPLLFDGDRNSSITSLLPNILSLDLSNPKQYCENLVSLSPQGLVPMLLGLHDNPLFTKLLAGYRAQVKLLQYTSRRPDGK